MELSSDTFGEIVFLLHCPLAYCRRSRRVAFRAEITRILATTTAIDGPSERAWLRSLPAPCEVL